MGTFHRDKMSGIATGKNKGFIVSKTKFKKLDKKSVHFGKNTTRGTKPSHFKGRLTKRNKVLRQIIREVSGFTPYEHRIIELLKGGGANPQKRAWRFAKNRLGTHTRARRKVVEMEQVISGAK